ncbi:hypothetical protein GobsT_64230 [Gemmata obscuriglobus]|uniref:Uncharacterized protein n=1 Tax=Gemmata obscuriglobus TaxID=114 RepID=A0A2Z3GWB1_9BACT|nr:AAA family ATPase [Gemmata obscuriglobus]AWM35857.1 hypothetical protein C1280_01695 [Gemmata obscuriglobus]QEG31601.1 hypothetical protein GobsT_64230 [Gemmata obscuriglobus]VTS10943.1 Uncharacterized protein OS=Isosphaera pallida (strain ATCC 43644 / DSM 9630 / IS1B) GN=Isop_2440 PE=4 SV=1: AAA_24 [Gemmata obscuriglobus UQM 2246]
MGILSSVTTTAPNLPPRFVMYAPEKAGKTSFGAQWENPLFLMTAGETGLLTLIESGQVGPTAHLPSSEENPTGFLKWDDLTDAVRAVINEPHDYRTLLVDTGNGAENLLAQHVCDTDTEFLGNWGEFNSFGRGERRCAPVWAGFLNLLDQVRVRRRMAVVLLYHSKAKQFNNPTGKDYEQWKPEGYERLWGLTHKWADVIGFYGLRVQVNKDDKAYKEERYLRVQPSAAIVAGNRYGLPDEVTSAPNAVALYRAFDAEYRKAKARGVTARKWSKEEFSALLTRKGKTWRNALSWIDKSFGTTHLEAKPDFASVSAEHVALYAAWLGNQPDAPPPPPPASPPPPPPPGPVPAPAPLPAATDDVEGEDRSDPTTGATRTPTTTAATPNAPLNSTTAVAKPTTLTTDPAPKPAPAFGRRFTAPPAPGADVAELLALMHQLDLSWPEVRDRAEGKGEEIAAACGIYGTPGLVLPELALSLRNRLRTELEVRVAEKKSRAAKRAANKAAREAVAS